MDIEIITSMQELENHPIKYHAADEVRRKLLELYYIAGNHYDYCHADYPVSGEPGDSAHLEKAVRFHFDSKEHIRNTALTREITEDALCAFAHSLQFGIVKADGKPVIEPKMSLVYDEDGFYRPSDAAMEKTLHELKDIIRDSKLPINVMFIEGDRNTLGFQFLQENPLPYCTGYMEDDVPTIRLSPEDYNLSRVSDALAEACMNYHPEHLTQKWRANFEEDVPDVQYDELSRQVDEAYQNIHQNFCKLALAVRDRVNEKACAKLEAFLPLEHRLQRASFHGLTKLRDQPKGMLSPSDRKTVEKLFKKYMNTKENGKEVSSPAR